MPARVERLAKTAASHDLSLPAGACSRTVALYVLAGAFLIPIVVSMRGADPVRLPKQLALHAVAIVAAAQFLVCLLLGWARLDDDARDRLRIPAIIAAAAAVWTAVAAVFSTNRILSAEAGMYVGSLLGVVLISAHVLRRHGIPALALAVLTPATINAVVVFAQVSRIWTPWDVREGARRGVAALLGNPNDVGAYMVPCVVFACAIAVATKRRRWLSIAVTIVLATAMVLTLTLTALAATTAALVVLAATVARTRVSRHVAVPAAAAVAVLISGSLFYPPFQERAVRAIETVADREFGAALSGRTIAFAAAWEMFAAHPLTGVGPGAFKYNFMAYRVLVDREYPWLDAHPGSQRVTFQETHSDHLQVLAETGIPGYAIMAAGIIYVGRRSRRRPLAHGDERARITAALALPLTVGLAVTMLTGFPLQLAAVAYTYAILAGACIAWEDRERVA